MRMTAYAQRNFKELVRDPVSLLFGVGLPVVLLVLMSFLQRSIAVSHFRIDQFAPSMAMFSFSFISMFTSMLVSNDRTSSFLTRLFASPLTAGDYLAGYSLPLLPIALAQSVVCFVVAFFFGLPVNGNVLLSIVALLPIAVFFIGLGLLLGCLLANKQVGAISSIVVQVAALSSGMWFDLSLIGGAFRTVCYALPFAHAVDAARMALAGDWAGILPHVLWCIGYAVAVFAAAVLVFRRKMKA